MELVKSSIAAIAVDDSLTTLLDWVNIESVSGFTLIVENAAGGSGNDITDVQVDTSVDGGVTILTDQHAGVPAVPIASGASSTGTFTESAPFVRVRALCASGEDTTAKAFLMADTSTGRICTLADVRDRLGLSDTDHDPVISRIITGLESVFNNYCNRTLVANAADVTEYYTGAGPHLMLRRTPVISITSIKEAWDYDFDNADALVANTGYRIVAGGKNGIVYRVNIAWRDTVDGVQVIYRGGYCAAGQSPGSGETAMPADLREAAIEQATFLFKRRDDIGLSSVGHDGGSINKFSAMKLLPMVADILKNYKRPSL